MGLFKPQVSDPFYIYFKVYINDLFDNLLLDILLDMLFVNNTLFFIVVKNHTQPGYDLNTDLTLISE